MTATEEALAAMAKAEEAWNKMVDERVQVSGQFVKDGKAFQQEYQEAFADAPEQDERFQ
jgi:hypothetical protein